MRHRLVLRTFDGQELVTLSNVISWDLLRTANDIGWWVVTLEPDFPREFLRIDNIMEFWRQPSGAAETFLGAGLLRYFEWSTDDQDRTTLRLGGPDPIELLKRRIIQNFAETAYSQKNGYADDLMKEIVDEQFVSTANRLGDIYYSRSSAIPSSRFQIAPDTSGGYATAGFQGAWRDCLSVIQELAEASWNQGTRIYFDFDYPAPGLFLFQTWADLRGVDRTVGTEIAPIIFSQEQGNLSNPLLRFDYTEEVNFVYGGGQGQGTAREVDPENDEPRSQLSAFNRREAFQDARECPAGETPTYCIATRAFNTMQGGRPLVLFEGDLIDTPKTRFGVDWFYGDKVTVQYKGYELDGRVDHFQLSTNEDGTESLTARVSILEAIQGHPD